MKRKGFTLIELVVVVAIILLLAATLAPKLRKEVAKARDAKAVAALGSLRTAANVFLADKGYAATAIYGTDGKAIMSTTSDYLENNVIDYLNTTGTPAKDAAVPIGGARALATDPVTYGGAKYIAYTVADIELEVAGTGTVGSLDTAYTVTSSDVLDTKGNEWAKY